MSFSLPNHSLTLSLPTYRAPCFVSTGNEEKAEKDPSFQELKRTTHHGGGSCERTWFAQHLLLPILFLIFFINNLEHLFNNRGLAKSYMWVSSRQLTSSFLCSWWILIHEILIEHQICGRGPVVVGSKTPRIPDHTFITYMWITGNISVSNEL